MRILEEAPTRLQEELHRARTSEREAIRKRDISEASHKATKGELVSAGVVGVEGLRVYVRVWVGGWGFGWGTLGAAAGQVKPGFDAVLPL